MGCMRLCDQRGMGCIRGPPRSYALFLSACGEEHGEGMRHMSVVRRVRQEQVERWEPAGGVSGAGVRGPSEGREPKEGNGKSDEAKAEHCSGVGRGPAYPRRGRWAGGGSAALGRWWGGTWGGGGWGRGPPAGGGGGSMPPTGRGGHAPGRPCGCSGARLAGTGAGRAARCGHAEVVWPTKRQ